MATDLEGLRVLKSCEDMCDSIWNFVQAWNEFARNSVGLQLVRASDSIGANIAEAHGRFNFGKKTQFLSYARGSLFETKYWLNRVSSRRLIDGANVTAYLAQLAAIARQLNAFVASIKSQRRDASPSRANVRESRLEYQVETPLDMLADDACLFTELEIAWLQSAISNLQSPISNP